MRSFLAKIWPKNAKHFLSTWRPWALKTSTFGITRCDNFWPKSQLKVAEGFHIRWRMLAAHPRYSICPVSFKGRSSARTKCKFSEEDKRATTNVQNGLAFFFLFSFILFSYFWTKTAVNPLIPRKSRGGKILKNSEKVWKCVENCQKVWKSAETILPFSCCPLVFLWKFVHQCAEQTCDIQTSPEGQ